MADTAVAITAGTGTNIDTRTEATNGNHRQVIVIGDPDANAGVAAVDPSAGLKVNLGADNDVTMATLPDTAGGALAAIATSAAVMDDWDESDRAKVNIIVGQAGVAAGAGVVGVTVPRVTLASDDPAVVALQALDNAISGTELQVDIVAALPAGTNNIGDVDVLTLPALPAGTNNIGDVDVLTLPALPAGTNNIGDVDVLTVPADPFGADADAASATGSISAKLRGIATALGVTALDLGSGTGGSRTLRLFKDTAQWIGGAGAVTSATMRATLASDDPAVAGLGGTADAAATAGSTGSINAKLRLMTTQLASLTRALDGDYETVAASQTNQVLGPTGATGDFLAGVLIVPATTSPGLVTILDNATSINIFAGGASSVTNLVPFLVPLGMVSVSGSWRITTGANVSCIGIGSFT